MTLPTLYVEGPALWAPTLPGWDVARAALRDEGRPTDPPVKRPAPLALAPAERRRAPDSVAIALEAASAAVAASGRSAADLPCIFASSYGDLAINDYMCNVLATHSPLLSPTKFHNSVHNAAAGYWTIGTGCMASSNSLSASPHSFAAGLLEAATHCAADQQAVLLVGFDIEAVGPLGTVIDSRGLLAVALVLAPERGAHSVAALDISLSHQATAPTLRSEAARMLPPNGIGDALPFFEAIARDSETTLALPLSAKLALQVNLRAM